MLRAHKAWCFIIIICGPGNFAHSRRAMFIWASRLGTFGGPNDVNKCLFLGYSDMPYNSSFKLALRLKRRYNDRHYFNISPRRRRSLPTGLFRCTPGARSPYTPQNKLEPVRECGVNVSVLLCVMYSTSRIHIST